MRRTAWSARSTARRTCAPRRCLRRGWCVLGLQRLGCGGSPWPVQEEAGLRTWTDVVGNVHGRVEVRSLSRPPRALGGLCVTRFATQGSQPCPALMLGSHYDTVIDGGRYDGALGVVVAISALKAALRELAPGSSLRCPVRDSCRAEMLACKPELWAAGRDRRVQRRRRRSISEHFSGEQGDSGHTACFCSERHRRSGHHACGGARRNTCCLPHDTMLIPLVRRRFGPGETFARCMPMCAVKPQPPAACAHTSRCTSSRARCLKVWVCRLALCLPSQARRGSQ